MSAEPSMRLKSGRIEEQVKVVASPRNQIKSLPRQRVGGFSQSPN